MRRIMRPSADAGRPATGGEAAAPDAPLGEPNPGANPFARPAGEPTTAESPATGSPAAGPADEAAGAPADEPATTELPAVAAPSEAPAAEPAAEAAAADATAVLPVTAADQPAGAGEEGAAAGPPARPRRRLFPRRPKAVARGAEAQPVVPEGEAPPVAEAAVVLPAADGPAGLDPAEAEMRPPAGRRGRLRRRLRHLRRARELMLRDLGGLVFEIHRTGGGDMTSHTPLVAGKVDRLRQLDAEAVALETALGAPRGETVVFQPGIGGTCAVCGELYASAARFCSECGTPTERPAPTGVAAPDPVQPGGSLGFAKATPASVVTSGDPLAPRPTPPEEARPAAAEQATVAESPAPAGTEAAAAESQPADEPAAAEPAEPERNGTTPPTLQPGDPLARRESP